jgi:hypothetical protein
MRNKRTFSITIAVVALAILTTFGIFRNTRTVQAQDQTPPPRPDRISFGLIGLTAGQAVRLSVVNTIMPNDANYPPGPTRVVLNFRGVNGELIRNRNGEVVRKTVDLERGQSTFLDLNYDEFPPGPTRLQVRAVVTVQVPPGPPDSNAIPYDSAVPTIEIINNANGKTQHAVFTHPAVIRGFNPQPDPPRPE